MYGSVCRKAYLHTGVEYCFIGAKAYQSPEHNKIKCSTLSY